MYMPLTISACFQFKTEYTYIQNNLEKELEDSHFTILKPPAKLHNQDIVLLTKGKHTDQCNRIESRNKPMHP